jgi:hypothetical protein
MATATPVSHQEKLRHAAKESLIRIKELSVMLAKAVLPFYILTEILKESGWLNSIAAGAAPVMDWWGLPGEASAVLVAGMLTSPYSAAAVIVPLDLSGDQITLLGFMITLAHALPLEGAIVREMLPGSFWSMTLLRTVLALGGGWVMAQIML